MRERHVVIIAFEGVQPIDAVGPHEVFCGARRAATAQGQDMRYRVTLASRTGTSLRAESGLLLGTVPLPATDEPIDTLLIAGGHGATTAAADEELLEWIRAVVPQCRRVATVCSGAFIGAAAGIFDGRRVTTHWARAQQLAKDYPTSRWMPIPSTSATASTGPAPE